MAPIRSGDSAGLVLDRPATRRQLGAYYTPRSAANYMADWLVRHADDHILDPSFGDGMFLHAVLTTATQRNLTAVQLSGVEIDETTQAWSVLKQQSLDIHLRHDDFLNVAPFKVQAIIGNPPYVRLRQLAQAQRERALQSAQLAMGQPMEPSGSLWMPFVLHALHFLEQGGRMAFVLPYELTYVRYARPLWKLLGRHFGSLQVLRTHERLFPDLLQDVVILLADDYGAYTSTIRYQAFELVQDLLNEQPIVDEAISIAQVLAGERVFIGALLGKPLRNLLANRISNMTTPARNIVTFNIGYVSGDKDFFTQPTVI